MEDVNGAVKIWQRQLSNKVARTRREYVKAFLKFAKWAAKTPDELRIMKYEEEREQEPWLRTQVEDLVRQYMAKMKEEGYTGNYMRYRLSAIKSFFAAQNMPLTLKRNDNPRIANENASGVPSHSEVKKIVECANNLRNKALILFLKDSGLRISDVARLKWKDLEDFGNGYIGFQIVTQKNQGLARGFVGAETVEVLRLYKRQRLRGTKTVTPEKNIKDHPVFCPLTISGHFNNGENMMQPKVIGARVSEVISLAGYQGKYSAHGMRKFFEQNVRSDREAYIKQLNGRTLNQIEKAYYWRTTEQLFQLYMENYDGLRVFGTTIKDSDIEKLVEERLNERLKEELNLRDEEVKAKIAGMEQQLKMLTGMIELVAEGKAGPVIHKLPDGREYRTVGTKLEHAERLGVSEETRKKAKEKLSEIRKARKKVET